MTTDSKTPDKAPEQPWLSFSPEDLVGLRVTQADLARLFDVSRNTISQWVRKGWITAGPDGRIDPRRATDEIMHRVDAGKFRARVFRGAVAHLTNVEKENKALKQRLSELEHEHATGEFWYCRLARFEELLDDNAGTLRAARSDEEFADLVAELYWEADEDCRNGHAPPGNTSGAPLAGEGGG